LQSTEKKITIFLSVVILEHSPLTLWTTYTLTLGPFLLVFMVSSNLKTSTELSKMTSVEKDSK